MSYLPDTLVVSKPSGSSGALGQLVYIAPDPSNPETFLNVRLSNGAGYYTAGGTTISGGAALSADQGSPGLLSAAWPVKLSNGSSVVGVEGTPLWVTGTLGLTQIAGFITSLSGSVVGLLAGGQPTSLTNPLPTSDVEPLVQWRYDFSAVSIYSGWAPRGESTGSAVWTVKRVNLDIDGNPTDIKWSITGSWESRIALQYS